MNISLSKSQLRITALWAFSEAFLGGILHGFHVPFAGLVLSAFASICMAALTLHDFAKGKILKATLLVIIVKAVLSPHTPPTAYFAVLLQGFFGELIFSTSLPYFISCMCNGIFALLQTAFQKLIVLTILFGTGFWKAMDEFLNGINKEFGVTDISYSYYFVLIFILLHSIAGMAAGIFAGKLPKLLQSSFEKIPDFANASEPGIEVNRTSKNKNKFRNPLTWMLFFILLIALFNIYAESGPFVKIKNRALMLLFRSALILLLWYFFIAPVLLKWFHKWITRQKNKFAGEVENILLLIPEMKYIAEQCWRKAAERKGLRRISKFIRLTFFTMLNTGK